MKEGELKDKNLYVTCQENAICTTGVMLEFIEQILAKRGERHFGPSLALLDEWGGQKTSAVLNAFRCANIHVLYIPGGMTSHLQLLDK